MKYKVTVNPVPDSAVKNVRFIPNPVVKTVKLIPNLTIKQIYASVIMAEDTK